MDFRNIFLYKSSRNTHKNSYKFDNYYHKIKRKIKGD